MGPAAGRASDWAGSGSVRETSGDEGARGDGAAGPGGTVARPVRAARDEPRVGPVDLGAPRRLLRAAGRRRRRHRGGRGGVGPRLGLALRAVPAGRRVRARLGRDRRRRCTPRRPGAGRRIGHTGGQGSSAYSQRPLLGAERRPRGQHPRDAQGDGARRHRRRRAGLRRGRRAGHAQRARRGRGQRRAEQPRAPVPLRPHQPARRRVRHRPAALRPRGAARRAGRCRRGHRRPAAVVRRAGALGRHRARGGRRDRGRRWRRGSTTWSSCGAASSRWRRPAPTATTSPASTSTSCATSEPRSARRVPVFAQGSIVDVGQAEWAHRRRPVRRRGDDPGPDRRPRPGGQGPRRRRSIASGRASSATRPARSATPATRSSAAWSSPGPASRRPTPTPRSAPTDRRPRPLDVLVVGAGVAGLECARVAAAAGPPGHRGRAHAARPAAWCAPPPPGPGASAWPPWPTGSRPSASASASPSSSAARSPPTDLEQPPRPAPGGALHREHRRDRAARHELRHRRRRPWCAPRSTCSTPSAAARSTRRCRPARWWSGIPSAAPSPCRWPRRWSAGGHEVALVTPDLIVGTLLSRSGDLAPANVRLAGAGVVLHKRARAARGAGRRPRWSRTGSPAS